MKSTNNDWVDPKETFHTLKSTAKVITHPLNQCLLEPSDFSSNESAEMTEYQVLVTIAVDPSIL